MKYLSRLRSRLMRRMSSVAGPRESNAVIDDILKEAIMAGACEERAHTLNIIRQRGSGNHRHVHQRDRPDPLREEVTCLKPQTHKICSTA